MIKLDSTSPNRPILPPKKRFLCSPRFFLLYSQYTIWWVAKERNERNEMKIFRDERGKKGGVEAKLGGLCVIFFLPFFAPSLASLFYFKLHSAIFRQPIAFNIQSFVRERVFLLASIREERKAHQQETIRSERKEKSSRKASEWRECWGKEFFRHNSARPRRKHTKRN